MKLKMKPVNVLVVDDERVICNGCRMILEEKGYCVTIRLTCREGIEAVRSRHYDVILLDIKLPDLDGTELLKTVRDNGRKQHIIVMSGYATVKNVVSSMRLGAVDFLRKPFTDDELLSAVAEVSRRYHES